jgi:hypothetical protein
LLDIVDVLEEDDLLLFFFGFYLLGEYLIWSVHFMHEHIQQDGEREEGWDLQTYHPDTTQHHYYIV